MIVRFKSISLGKENLKVRLKKMTRDRSCRTPRQYLLYMAWVGSETLVATIREREVEE